jgi:hypothetical protein
MRLENERDPLYSSRVRAFSAFSEPLFDEFLWISQLGDGFARRAFAAKVVRQAFAIGGLSEHPGERELAYATRPGKQQGVRNASGAQRSTKGGHDFGITEESGKSWSLVSRRVGVSSHV